MKNLITAAAIAVTLSLTAGAAHADAVSKQMASQATAISAIASDLMSKVETQGKTTVQSDGSTATDLSSHVVLNDSLENALVSSYTVSAHGVIALTLNKTAILAPLAGDIITLTPMAKAESADTAFQHKAHVAVEAWTCTVVRPSGQANPADFALGGTSGRNVWLSVPGPLKDYCSKVALNTAA
mgnify:CR=1 FL=1|jgi:hypothetical protein